MAVREFVALRLNQVSLTAEERAVCLERKAVWHFYHGTVNHRSSTVTPAVWKSNWPRGEVTYVANTHRAYDTAPTLEGAIRRFHDFIKGTA